MINDEEPLSDSLYMKAYRAGWNDALQELLMEIEEGFTYEDLRQMVKYMAKP